MLNEVEHLLSTFGHNPQCLDCPFYEISYEPHGETTAQCMASHDSECIRVEFRDE